MKTLPRSVALVAALALSSGCSFLWTSKPRSALPHGARASDLDEWLPKAFTLFKRRTPTIDLDWMANTEADWTLVRHDLSGAVLRRAARLVYTFRASSGGCAWNDVWLVQEYVGGQFGPAEIRGPVLSSDGRLPVGNAIECSVVDATEIGYRGRARLNASATPR